MLQNNENIAFKTLYIGTHAYIVARFYYALLLYDFMSFNFLHFLIFWEFLVPPGGTAGPLATPLIAILVSRRFIIGQQIHKEEQ